MVSKTSSVGVLGIQEREPASLYKVGAIGKSHMLVYTHVSKHTQTGIYSACTVHRYTQKCMLLSLQTHRLIESIWVHSGNWVFNVLFGGLVGLLF